MNRACAIPCRLLPVVLRLVAPALLLAVPGGLAAQSQGGRAASAAPAVATKDAATTAEFTGPLDLTVTLPKRQTRCGMTNGRGEIVVCGTDRGEDLKVPGSADDPNSREGRNNGIIDAPNVSGLVDCKIKKCRSFGGVPPPVLVIDLKAIKEAPKGSDADKVANGEMSDR